MLTTPQYLDKTDSADRRPYSCDIIKTVQATEATGGVTSKPIAADTLVSWGEHVHCVHVRQFATGPPQVDCKLRGWAGRLSMQCVQ